MTTARKSDPIPKITTKSGETRYRFIIDVGKRPDGKRDQRCYTFTKLGEARPSEPRSSLIAPVGRWSNQPRRHWPRPSRRGWKAGGISPEHAA